MFQVLLNVPWFLEVFRMGEGIHRCLFCFGKAGHPIEYTIESPCHRRHKTHDLPPNYATFLATDPSTLRL